MAKRVWRSLPGGRLVRWRKSRGDSRPGGGTTRFCRQVPPRWYRNALNRRERRRVQTELIRGSAGANPYVHPRSAAWYW